MPVQEPADSELWQAVRPLTQWPRTDEDRVDRLAQGWNSAGAGFLYVGSGSDGTPPGNVNPAWPDAAGADFQAARLALRKRVSTTGQEMKHLSWLAGEFAFDVGYTKNSIAALVRQGDAVWATLQSFPFGPDHEARRLLVIEVAGKINGFLDLMAARVAARGAGQVEQPLPDAPDLPGAPTAGPGGALPPIGRGRPIVGGRLRQPRRGCFPAGTPVLTGHGHRPIEQLAVGDLVHAADPRTDVNGLRRVAAVMTHTVFDQVDLSVAGVALSCSPEHPFWVDGKGWTKAGDLAVGDVVRDIDRRPRRIESVVVRTGVFTVHNIEVEGLHTYHVSTASILVHNKPVGPPEPAGVPRTRSESWFKRNGMEPHELKRDLPGPASHFDLYVDRVGNIFGVRKGDDPRNGEYIGNVADYDE